MTHDKTNIADHGEEEVDIKAQVNARISRILAQNVPNLSKVEHWTDICGITTLGKDQYYADYSYQT